MSQAAAKSRLPWPAGRFEAITFDCYGTLIDWRPGILQAARRLLDSHGIKAVRDEKIVEQYNRLEREAERPPYRTYREVLAFVVRGFGRAFGFRPAPEELGLLAASLADWEPYPDTVSALRVLKTRYRLGIISNVDDDLFARTRRRLEVPLDWVVTAQSVGSYKPSRRNFKAALDRMGLGRDKILHAAQSLHHDIAAVSPMGWATVWVNRYGKGPDPAGTADAKADLEVPDLKTLAALLTAG